MVKKKTTEEFIKEMNDFYGYDPYELKGIYTNKSTPIDGICNTCHNNIKVYPYRVQRDIAKNKKTPPCRSCNSVNIEYYINLMINKYGKNQYIFKGEYIDNHTPIDAICIRCKNNINVIPNKIKSNIENNLDSPCRYCANKNLSKNKTKYFLKEEYQNDLDLLYGKEKSYTVIDELGELLNTPIMHRCNICEYEWKVRPNYLINNNGNRICPRCNKMERIEIPYCEWVIMNRTNIEVLEDYISRRTPIKHLCKICNKTWKTAPANIYAGNGCLNCSKHKPFSKFEEDIKELIINNDVNNIVMNSRKILPSGKELDIYLPEFKLAIEINGLFWHSDRYKDKNYHNNKKLECESIGINLLQFYDDDLKDEKRKRIIYDKIIHTIGKTKNKIYARNCMIKPITKKDKKEFLNSNHLQGNDRSNFEFGLFTKRDNKLVAVITFVKLRKSLGHTKDVNDKIELSRYSTLINTLVIGGFSKLLKYSMFKFKDEYEKILTYADRNISTGNLYDSNGFKLMHISRPGYFYVDINKYKRYHRYTFRKNNLKKLFPDNFDPNKTEFEIMDSIKNFERVWNSGNNVYEINIFDYIE